MHSLSLQVTTSTTLSGFGVTATGPLGHACEVPAMIESEKMRHALFGHDIDFVLNLVREGARDGHYAPWMQEPAQSPFMRLGQR